MECIDRVNARRKARTKFFLKQQHACPTDREGGQVRFYLQVKRSWRHVTATLPTGWRAGKEMEMTHHSLTACVPASGTACEDARRSTERRSIHK
jgi:hypothetical protein